jgi:hypothetical protein
MAGRRTSDSQDSSRSTPPPPAAKKPAKAAGTPLSGAAVAPAATPASSAEAGKPRAAARKKQAVIAATPVHAVSEDERRGMIARAAYLRGQSRGFPEGGEAEDWLAAEKEIDALLRGAPGAAQ